MVREDKWFMEIVRVLSQSRVHTSRGQVKVKQKVIGKIKRPKCFWNRSA